MNFEKNITLYAFNYCLSKIDFVIFCIYTLDTRTKLFSRYLLFFCVFLQILDEYLEKVKLVFPYIKKKEKKVVTSRVRN